MLTPRAAARSGAERGRRCGVGMLVPRAVRAGRQGAAQRRQSGPSCPVHRRIGGVQAVPFPAVSGYREVVRLHMSNDGCPNSSLVAPGVEMPDYLPFARDVRLLMDWYDRNPSCGRVQAVVYSHPDAAQHATQLAECMGVPVHHDQELTTQKDLDLTIRLSSPAPWIPVQGQARAQGSGPGSATWGGLPGPLAIALPLCG